MKPVLFGVVLALISSLTVSGGECRAAENDNGNATEIIVAPSISGVWVDGDDNKFREDWWVEDGLKGGLERFILRRDLGAGTTIEAKGRAILPEEDYLIDLRVDKRDVGYVRAGYQEYRKYFDDTGGFFTSFNDSSFDLGKDMHLDIGTIFVEAGLTLPDKPKVIIGYEHRFKDGEKSLLEWGRVSEGGINRNIFPAYKDIDEKVDIVRLEVSHDIANVHLGDEFRYENYRIDTRRFEERFDADTDTTTQTVTLDENYEHNAFYNTLHASTHLNDKTFLSLGYLYSNLEGDASFSMMTLDGAGLPGTGSHDKGWMSDAIDIDQKVHIVNANAIFGPFYETTIYLGLQGESLETDGDMDGDLQEPPGTPNPATIDSEQDKWSVEETLGVRYAGLPRTTLYAEGRWTQQDIDLTEREVEGVVPGLSRYTDTDVCRQRYSIGFNSSPLPRTTIAGRYRFKYRSNDYDHEVDSEPDGYSAFILDQDIKTHEVMAKVSFRPVPTVRTSLQYQLVAMDIQTNEDTDPLTDVQTTNYDANIYTASVTATPLAGLFVTGLVSYQDVELKTVDLADAPVGNYDGDVLTLAASAGMALDQRTNLNVQYSYSMTDNFEDISADGLPLGVENQRHLVLANLNRQISDNLSVKLRYGFYYYDDEASDGEDNYTAHMVGATCRLVF
jgi:hypothetical protein